MRRNLAIAGLAIAMLLLLGGLATYGHASYAAYQQERLVPASSPVSSADQQRPDQDATGEKEQAGAVLTSAPDDSSPAASASSEVTPFRLSTPAPALYRPPTRIVIPAIGVDAPVVPVGIDASGRIGAADSAAGHFSFSKYPGEQGNSIITGHVDTKGEVFRWLHKLEPEDEVRLFAGDKEYVYIVVDKRIVDPSDKSPLADTPDATLTLITCYPYGIDTQRLIVTARLSR